MFWSVLYIFVWIVAYNHWVKSPHVSAASYAAPTVKAVSYDDPSVNAVSYATPAVNSILMLLQLWMLFLMLLRLWMLFFYAAPTLNAISYAVFCAATTANAVSYAVLATWLWMLFLMPLRVGLLFLMEFGLWVLFLLLKVFLLQNKRCSAAELSAVPNAFQLFFYLRVISSTCSVLLPWMLLKLWMLLSMLFRLLKCCLCFEYGSFCKAVLKPWMLIRVCTEFCFSATPAVSICYCLVYNFFCEQMLLCFGLQCCLDKRLRHVWVVFLLRQYFDALNPRNIHECYFGCLFLCTDSMPSDFE